MNILAIDTTTKKASVSVKKDNTLFMDNISNEVTHSEKLLPLIDKVLTKSNIKISEIEKLACINGPGSFTGIRIGLATVKALAQVNDIDIFSIDSLDLIAYSSYILNLKSNYIVSMIGTNNDRVYYCIYKLEMKDEKIVLNKLIDILNDYIDEAVLNIQNILNKLNIKDFSLAGNCINEFKEDVVKLNCKVFDFYPTTNDCINAISYIEDISSYTFNAYSLKATYARASQAERMKNGQV